MSRYKTNMKKLNPTLEALTLGDLAPDATVFTPAGATVTLASFWQTGPILLTFLRHFG